MTVTLNLDPTLLAHAEAEAAREGRTVGQLVGEALTQKFALKPATFRPKMGHNPDVDDPHPDRRYEDRDGGPLVFPVFYGGTGGGSTIDWTSNASIYAAMDEEDDERMRRWSTGESPEL